MNFAELARTLTARAAALGKAHGEARCRDTRWHDARLLWPLFTRGVR